ncbi:MAG TPA: fumarylacetoacetate hydrolase family protein [Stellaceae bacterium]|nr:fumarylacetoacetate hydrolase family protein [Stellaceae bacterium]
MRIISYSEAGESHIGVMTDTDSFIAAAEAAPQLPRSLRVLVALPDGLARLRDAVAGKQGTRSLNAVTSLPVIPDPHVTWALALNFKTHIEETGLATSRDFPHLFIRMPASLVGYNQPLLCPPPEVAREFDYEGELVAIVGRGGRHIPVEKAFDHIAGFACGNEGSVREYQRHNRNFGLGKNFERSGSVGPWLMTSDEFGDPRNQRVVTRLNGIERQNAPLDDMLFSVAQVVHYLSTGYTLLPGDMIMMGTPGALPPHPGETLQPSGRHKILGQVNMKPGDRVEVEITGLGVLANTIVADESAAYRTR